MAREVQVTANAETQIILIDQDGEQIAIYPSFIPRLVADLMLASVCLGVNMDFPVKAPAAPVTFNNKGN